MKKKLLFKICCMIIAFPVYAHIPSYVGNLVVRDLVGVGPLRVYHYFPVDSDLLIPERSNAQPTSVPSNIIHINSINENNLAILDAENFYQMLQNSPNISKEEIVSLWRLFTSNHVNKDVKLLFYDFISFENPDYLTHDIIKQAKKEKGEVRHKLLVALQYIYQKKLEKNDQTDLSDIMNYFQTLQSQTLDKNDGGIVYRGLATLAPQHIDTAQVNLTNMDKIHVDLLNLKHDRAHEILYVQDMIHHLDHPDDSLVVTASYQYLTQLLIGSDLHFFSKKSKLLFKEHLDRKSLINHHQSMLYASAYLEFKAALNAKKPDDIPLLTKSYIQDLDPDLQEPAFNGLMGITKDTKNRLKFNHQK